MKKYNIQNYVRYKTDLETVLLRNENLEWANYWKVRWGVDSIPVMKVNKSDRLGPHNERHAKQMLICLYSLVE